MKKVVILILVVSPVFKVHAQEENEKKFGINFSGFVKTDFIFDSRQTVAAREGHFLLWPAAEFLDDNGDDINAKANFNILSIQSRLTGEIAGPDAFGAKTSGLLEGAFFGHSDSDVNGFCLRHAFAKLNWPNTELLFGQYWHPMFVTGCFPGVISFNTGSPFQPFSRNPQIRFTQSFGNTKLSVAALSQRDFTSASGSASLRNSAIPEIQMRLLYNKKNKEADSEFLAGFGAGYKMLTPRLQTDSLIKADESTGSYCTEVFLKIKTKELTIKIEYVYGQNTYDLLGISSFAIKSIDLATDNREYSPLSSMAFWADIHTNGKKMQGGIFTGYTRNLGGSEDILTTLGTRSNIDYITRISPRLIFNSGRIRFAGELEITTAAFGTVNSKGKVEDAIAVSNVRLLLAGYYFF